MLFGYIIRKKSFWNLILILAVFVVLMHLVLISELKSKLEFYQWLNV